MELIGSGDLTREDANGDMAFFPLEYFFLCVLFILSESLPTIPFVVEKEIEHLHVH